MKALIHCCLLMGAALLAFTAVEANAALLVYEPFDYGPQDNTTKFLRSSNNHNGGTGWADKWMAVNGNDSTSGGVRLDTAEVTQPYPAGTSLTSTGGRIENDFGTAESRRQFSANLPNTSYFSALINWSTGSAFGIQLGDTTNDRWIPLDVNTSGELKIGGTSLTAGFVQLTAGVDYLVVGRRTSSGADRTLVGSVFEVGNPGNFLTEPVTWDLSFGPFASGVALSHLDVFAENENTSVIDEIRFGTTYADVVGLAIPEPSTLALFGLGVGALCLSRRRRR